MNEPIICFGQQPCGFFPKNYLTAKIHTAKTLQQQIGGQIVFFYHDSDADYRETITILKDLQTGKEARLNFTQENKLQKNFSPLYLKRIPKNWREETLKQLPRFVSSDLIELFKSVPADNVADFCLEMYKKLGLLDKIEVVRSSDKDFRTNASDLTEDIYADITYENETVRAKVEEAGKIGSLHHGGGKYTKFAITSEVKKDQITPGRDHRFMWMNSVIHSTHYITGNSEYDYLKREEFPEVKFIKRNQIENQDLAWLP